MILTDYPNKKFEVIHAVLVREGNMLTVGHLCEIAGVSRAGYYKWVNAAGRRAEEERQDAIDFTLIIEAYKYKGYDKGVEGIHMRLLRLTPPVVMNLKKIRRLMRKYGLQCPIRQPNPYREMAKARQAGKVAANLLNREFRAHGPRAVLLTDITYIPRGDGKFSYLSVIMDAFTKEILSHVCSASLEIDFVKETVEKLMAKHGKELKTDALIHSDQGTHYTSHTFIEIIGDFNLRQSMSRKGNCWDNAPQECLFGHMKDEIHIIPSDGNSDIRRKIDEWVDYYNNERGQWNLRRLAPAEYYQFVTTGFYPLPIPVPVEPKQRVRRKKVVADANAETTADINATSEATACPS